MTQMLEAVIDESGGSPSDSAAIHQGHPLCPGDDFRCSPRLPSETNAPDIGQGEVDSEEAKALFGIWKDNPAVDSVNGYLQELRRERF